MLIWCLERGFSRPWMYICVFVDVYVYAEVYDHENPVLKMKSLFGLYFWIITRSCLYLNLNFFFSFFTFPTQIFFEQSNEFFCHFICRLFSDTSYQKKHIVNCTNVITKMCLLIWFLIMVSFVIGYAHLFSHVYDCLFKM